MIYCTNCGAENPDESNFCGKCGKPLHGGSQAQQQQRAETPDPKTEKTLWEGRPSDLGDQIRTGLLMNNVHYKLTSQRLIITTGLIGKKTEELELVRIKDVALERTVTDRMMGVGTITVFSTDPSTPEIKLEDVKDAEKVKDILRDAVRAEKETYRTRYREDL
ncbi:PH domain-containing protein [Saccharibacillus sp. CPCC 101409]|uniref:PH domain-containing protein n=1 Tax=Saccharibacillus sp. CPCC 101409 TaxID=3058041 RepID=UPI0026715596|nr:PH domain-containing protein [Saccharibacillus sp. CPCC 101409]MDO3409152.1 PH domain-containing protein [Saccharibacillus sp. CPCC 101409]